MAVNNVILYFPWGAGGNLIRNIITLDTRYEFYDDQQFQGAYPTIESRYEWVFNYYNQPISSETWLKREWSIRDRLYHKYYDNSGPAYWNPDALLVYDCHGDPADLKPIQDDIHLKHFDRFQISAGNKSEQDSPWGLHDCNHIFLIPVDVIKITEIYNSKNPVINQLDQNEDIEYRRKNALAINQTMTMRLKAFHYDLVRQNKSVLTYDADALFLDSGVDIILDVVAKFNLNIPLSYIKTLHSKWLQDTREVYYNYFNRELKL